MPSRSSRVLAALCLLLLVASGCTSVDLTGRWPAMGEPTGWEPRQGVCSHGFSYVSLRSAYQPVDCGATHVFETVHIGRFAGEAAKLDAPPQPGSAQLSAAYAECGDKTSQYLGGSWQQARIWFGVSLPVKEAWDAGVRWFQCEAAVAGIGARRSAWSKSLRGELASSEELLRTCVQIFDDDTSTKPMDCGQPHNGELVGMYVADGEYKAFETEPDAMHSKCRSLVATYVGVPEDRNLSHRTGTSFVYPTSRDWSAGDRIIQCYLYLSKNVTRSLKGGGVKVLPID